MNSTQFYGWRFGGTLNAEQAAELEPVVDVMTETLQELLRLNSANLKKQNQHTLALTLAELVGRSAGLINDISMTMLTEKNEDEKLAVMNRMASSLRSTYVTLMAISNIAVVALDETLKGNDQ